MVYNEGVTSLYMQVPKRRSMRIQKNLGLFNKLNERTNRTAPGDVFFEAEDIGPDEWRTQRYKLTNNPLTSPPDSLDVWRSRCSSGRVLTLIHPISQQTFTFDLSPWDGVDGKQLLRVDFTWVRRGFHPGS